MLEALGPIVAGAVAGLASVPHCAAMCGPLAAFACRGGGGGLAGRAVATYQLARFIGYSAAGALAGSVGAAATGLLSAPVAQAILSWTFAAGLGWSAWRLWRSAVPGKAKLDPQPYQQTVRLRTKSESKRAFTAPTIGLLTTLLPCGALYAAFLLAAGSGGPLMGAGAMGAFALTSGLGLLGASLLGRFLDRLGVGARKALAVAMALGAIVLILRPIDRLRGEPDTCHTQRVSLSAERDV